jgi:hypothetical protein
MRAGKKGWCRAGIVMLIGMAAFVVSAPPATTQSSDPPQYDSGGNLLRPVGFETWTLVGSNLGLAYKEELTKTGFVASPPEADKPMFHNVYISPQAFAEFVKTQKFPDLTVFVIDVLTAADKEPKGVLTAGVYNDKRVAIEVAVKNQHRPDGKTTPWAYYQFPMKGNPPKLPDSAKAEEDATCENCHHKVNASTDNVWVQFYPILRNMMK